MMGVDVGKRDSPFYQARKALQVEEEKEQRHVVSWSGLRSGIGKLDESPFPSITSRQPESLTREAKLFGMDEGSFPRPRSWP